MEQECILFSVVPCFAWEGHLAFRKGSCLLNCAEWVVEALQAVDIWAVILGGCSRGF